MIRIRRVLFIGSKLPGFRCLEEIYRLDPDSLVAVMTLDDRDDSRSAYDEFVAFAGANGVRLAVVKNRKDSEAVVRELEPELCLVHGWYWLISDETVDSVPKGFIGIHNSLLPLYRGGSPLVWTMINGDDKAGISLFSFSKGMDDGDIWAQASVPIEPDDYISDILSRLEEKTIALLREKYRFILEGGLRPSPQDHSRATYCAQRIPEDGLIDWMMPAHRIYDFIRAQSAPYPGAFTFSANDKMIVWKARPENIAYYGTAGQVARISADGVYVICGDNKPIVLQQIEAGGQRGSANKIIKSIKTRFPSCIMHT